MSIFPKIENISDLKPHVEALDEIRFRTETRNDMTVACYMVSAPNTFDTAWAQECRGITFDEDGAIASRPLHKFFNVNERESTKFENIPWDSITRIMVKRDGSMIHTVRVGSENSPFGNGGNTFDIKSKKSFESDVSVLARRYMNEHPRLIEFCEYLTRKNVTAIFEFTSPNARIVVAYPKPEMQVLHMRDNITGEYFEECVIRAICEDYDVSVVESDLDLMDRLSESTDIESFTKFAKTLHEEVEGIEGWVFQTCDGQMYKLKTKWYLDRHLAMTFLRERDVARMVLNESIDDLKAKLVGDGINIDEILEIESKVTTQLNQIAHDVTKLYNDHASMSRKDIALKLGSTGENHKYFNMVMQLYTGNEPKYVQYFERHCLDEQFELRQLTMVDSVADVE